VQEVYGGKDLRPALNQLSSKGIIIHPKLHSTYNLLYEYTNHKDSGIHHALIMDEAVFMIVTCSAFINYLNSRNTMV